MDHYNQNCCIKCYYFKGLLFKIPKHKIQKSQKPQRVHNWSLNPADSLVQHRNVLTNFYYNYISLNIIIYISIVLKHALSVPVSPEGSQTSVLLSQGTFSWQGPDSPNKEGETETGAKGSLLLHSLNLHITKVRATNSHM